jgi:hypothetical protein
LGCLVSKQMRHSKVPRPYLPDHLEPIHKATIRR